MRFFPRAPLVALLFVLAPNPDAHAQGILRAFYTGFFPAGDGLVARPVAPAPRSAEIRTEVTYEAGDTTGPALEYAQRIDRWFGWSVQVAYATLEIERLESSRVVDLETGATLSRAEFRTSDETVFVPLSGQFDVHLLPPGRVDLYAQLVFGFSWFDEVFGGWVDDHFHYGWGAGLDIDLTERWAIAGVVRYLQVEAEPREGGAVLRGTGEIDVDPWQVAVGVAYHPAPRGD